MKAMLALSACLLLTLPLVADLALAQDEEETSSEDWDGSAEDDMADESTDSEDLDFELDSEVEPEQQADDDMNDEPAEMTEPEAEPDMEAQEQTEPELEAEDQASYEEDAEQQAEPVEPAEPVQMEAAATEVDPAPPAVANKRKRVFGTYRFRLGASRPEFSGLEHYDKLFGNERLMPMVAGDMFAWDWYVTLGITFRGGFYRARGYTSRSPDTIQQNKDEPTTLTLVPVQLGVTTQFTPFPAKWLVVDGWVAYERLYYQEVRTIPDSDSDAESSEAMIALLQETETETDSGSLGYTGMKDLMSLGVALNIKLNALDEQSVNSMRGSLGLGSLYLSPFIEVVRRITSQGADFSRESYGVAFTFESVK